VKVWLRLDPDSTTFRESFNIYAPVLQFTENAGPQRSSTSLPGTIDLESVVLTELSKLEAANGCTSLSLRV
jgi:hypothetical protein